MADIELIKTKLISEGFSGLYNEGQCGCSADDLAPCGDCYREKGEKYINGCSPGYRFDDKENDGFFIVKPENKEPTDQEWVELRAEFL